MTRHFDSEKEAKEFLDELEQQIVAKVYETPPTQAEVMALPPAPAQDEVFVPTLVEYAQHLLDHRLAASLAKGTLGLYAANLKALTGFYGARADRPALRLDEIDTPSFLDYRAWRRSTRNSTSGTKTTVTAATLDRDQQFLCRVLNEAVLDGQITANPIDGLRKLKEPRLPRRYLTKDEIGALIRGCSWRFRPLVVAALLTGCRKSELVRLRWSDIDFVGGKIAIFRPETGTSDSLDLHPTLAAELRKLRARQEKRRKVGDEDPVFLSRRGTAFTNVSKSWALALAAAGLEKRQGLTFHTTRHTHATHFLEGGGAISDLQAQLGHAAASTTQIYAAAVNERRRATVLAMGFRPAVKARKTKRSA